MSNIKPGAQHAMQCDASQESGASHDSCSATGAGHAITALQERVAAATPSKWRDGIVGAAISDGWISVELLETGETTWVWNHSAASIGAGQPVALHALYNVLALGSRRFSVLVAAAVV